MTTDSDNGNAVVTRSELDKELRDMVLVSAAVAYFLMLFTVGVLMYYGAI